MSESKLRPIACQGLLYQGTLLDQPEEVWSPPVQEWVRYVHGSLASGGPRWISDTVANAMKGDNPNAEYFSHFSTPPWVQTYRRMKQPSSGSGERYYAIFEYDGALFRMPADRKAMIVDHVFRDGRWVPYSRDRVAPAHYGDFLRYEAEDQ